MPKARCLGIGEIRAALAELDELSRAEYEIPLEVLLTRKDPLSRRRMQRLAGIVLKKKFAVEGPPPQHGATGARRSWPWKKTTPAASATRAPKEFELLNELRKPGPWNERSSLARTSKHGKAITWEQFKDDAENERGLFKIVALYVVDKVNARKGKSLREYLDAEESRRFEAGLDLAVLLFDAAVTAPVAAALGLPTLAVGVSLVFIQYGTRAIMDPNKDRIGDSRS